MVRKWVRAFKDSHTNVHDKERYGRPCVLGQEGGVTGGFFALEGHNKFNDIL